MLEVNKKIIDRRKKPVRALKDPNVFELMKYNNQGLSYSNDPLYVINQIRILCAVSLEKLGKNLNYDVNGLWRTFSHSKKSNSISIHKAISILNFLGFDLVLRVREDSVYYKMFKKNMEAYEKANKELEESKEKPRFVKY